MFYNIRFKRGVGLEHDPVPESRLGVDIGLYLDKEHEQNRGIARECGGLYYTGR